MLTREEEETLKPWTRRPKTAQALARRARPVLAGAQGKSHAAVAAEVGGGGSPTGGTWRARFIARRLDGLLDEPRPGAPRRLSVITLTLESTPAEATPWSPRLWARRWGMSQSALRRIGRALALQPHRRETFKSTRDPLFMEKVREIVGLYLNPPDRALGPGRRCKDPDSGSGSHSAFAADAARPSRAAPPRLRSPRNPVAVCGLGPEERPGDGGMSPSASPGGVSPVPGQGGRSGSRLAASPLDSGQLGHAQDPSDPTLAGEAPSLPPAFHAHRRVNSGAGSIAARTNWKQRFNDIWGSIIGSRSPLSGPKQPTRSWPASPDFVSELPTQDTS